MSEERFWNTDEYASTAKFAVLDGAMTMRQAGRIFRLEPAPPKVEDINDYIISAVREKDMNYFTYFLHHYESRLNKRVYRFLLTEGIDRYDPLRFLDYKLSCVLVMLECLQNYVPDKGADFLTYAHHFIGNALLDCRRQEEAGSFKSLHCMALQQFRQERKGSHCRVRRRAELYRRNRRRISDPCKTEPPPCSVLFDHAGRGQRGNGRRCYL